MYIKQARRGAPALHVNHPLAHHARQHVQPRHDNDGNDQPATPRVALHRPNDRSAVSIDARLSTGILSISISTLSKSATLPYRQPSISRNPRVTAILHERMRHRIPAIPKPRPRNLAPSSPRA